MKDQNTIQDTESPREKWNRGLDIFIESIQKPDSRLRGCAHNQKCYHELLEIREEVIEHVRGMKYKLKPGEENSMKVRAINGISVTLLGGALGESYRKDWSEEHLNEWEDYVKGMK